MNAERTLDEADHRGQRYIRVGREPYTRRDGTETTLSVWRSNCFACGADFECKTADEAQDFRPIRSCPAHRERTWANRVGVTDPATVAPVTWPQRPFLPIDAYDDADDRGRRS